MICVIDNYDSFTFNLVQYLGEVSAGSMEIIVHRNDAISVEDVCTLQPTHIVISPGPCTPDEAGISIELVRACVGKIPLLGVCLGHQAIARAFGGRVVLADEVIHGKTTTIQHDNKGIFTGLPQDFVATRYHSLIVEEATLPQELLITARSPEGEIMAIRHRDYPSLLGLQFHPESILTEVGKQLLAKFLRI